MERQIRLANGELVNAPAKTNQKPLISRTIEPIKRESFSEWCQYIANAWKNTEEEVNVRTKYYLS